MALAQTTNKSNTSTDKPAINGGGDAVGIPTTTTTFYDFLGSKAVGGVRQPTESSLPPSATSDLGSGKNTGSRVEGGIPFYGSRGDIAGPENSSRLTGTKRNNSSDSFTMSGRDKLQVDTQDSSLWTKISGGDRPHDKETALRTHRMRPAVASFMPQLHPSKWGDTATAVNAGPVSQNAPCINPIMPFGYRVSSNRFRDGNPGPSIVSQAAADEGSRTGMKGSGILSLTNATGAASPGRQPPPSGVLIRIGKHKPNLGVHEPESSSIAPCSQGGVESSGSQMTIFYRGRAHVFDNVNPTKADAIMALAGSNGGSWTTNYASDT